MCLTVTNQAPRRVGDPGKAKHIGYASRRVSEVCVTTGTKNILGEYHMTDFVLQPNRNTRSR
jgi:hypothetical protein